MQTIKQLAGRFGLSRASLLYYEKKGLLLPSARSESGYRLYDAKACRRLEQICQMRNLGLPVSMIALILTHPESGQRMLLMQQHLKQVDQQIARLKQQRFALLQLLGQQDALLEDDMIDKKRWVEIMQAAGFSEDDMRRWHARFEALEPDAHEEFLQSLGIDEDERQQIRQKSATDWAKI